MLLHWPRFGGLPPAFGISTTLAELLILLMLFVANGISAMAEIALRSSPKALRHSRPM